MRYYEYLVDSVLLLQKLFSAPNLYKSAGENDYLGNILTFLFLNKTIQYTCPPFLQIYVLSKSKLVGKS